MSDSESRSGIVLELAEEFLERYRKGERPAIKEYIERHPELEAEIRDVFPAMAMMEKIALTEEGEQSAEPKEPKGKLPFEQLGDFRLIREVGRGGMGVVYEAEQVSLGRHVALKVLPQQIRDAKQRTRFEREAKAAAKLHHTNIVPVFGVGEQDGQPYYVMQFIQGLGLDAVLDELNRMQPGDAHTPTGLPTGGEIRVSRRDVSAADVARSLMTGAFPQAASDKKTAEPDPQRFFAPTLDQPSKEPSSENAPTSSVSTSTHLSDSFTVSSSSITLPNASKAGHKTSARKQTYWQSVANVGHQVADALDYAHKQGVQHRDIKPSNLLLDLHGTVWVTDFGLAKVAGPGADNLTHTGDVLGTLRYMPPEAFEGKGDIRGDVYSLGLTLYELIALQPAFSDRDRNKLIKQVTTGEPQRLDKVNREIPRDLVTIIHKAIDREPGRRYPSAEEFASDLQRFIDDEPILARRQTHIERYWRWARHHPGIATLGAALTAVLVIATVASLIVAGRMAKLADNQAKAADEERVARQEADDAKNREAQERAQAELAKQAAEESRQRAVRALEKAEENYAKARAAVNEYLTSVSEDERLQAPALRGLRVQLLQSALKFYQDFLKERGTDPTLRRELAGVHYKVGETYRDLGRSAPSRQSYIQSRALYEALSRESPNNPTYQHGLAMSLMRLGNTPAAIDILEKIVQPDDPRYQADLAQGYNDISLREISNETKQLEFLRKALVVRERLVSLKPDDAEARLGLSASLNNIAIRITEKNDADALELLRRAGAECEIAYRLRPANLTAARFLTIQLNNVARTARRLGLDDEAVAAQRRRVEVLDRRARDNPNVTGFDAELANGQALLLETLLEASRLDEAARAADKGRDRLAETTEESIEYFRQASYFQLVALKVALARAKSAPDPKSIVEPAAGEAVNALRRHVMAGWYDAKWMNTDSRTESLRQRTDFQSLQAQMDELAPAQSIAEQSTATVEDKLLARQKILVIRETLASSLPPSRFVRRSLAQARQDFAQALLVAGRADDARLAFDEALAARQELVREFPANEQVRADLAQSQSAAGDFFADAGKFADASRTWDQALETLEFGLKTNANSIPFQTALLQRLLHVADQNGKVGLWDNAERYYRRAFALQTPSEYHYWFYRAVLMLERGDAAGLRALATQAVPRLSTAQSVELLHLARIFLLMPDAVKLFPDSVRRGAEVTFRERDWPEWCRAMTALRLGDPEKALPLLDHIADPLQELSAKALVLHRLGRAAAATQALAQADQIAERRLRESLAQEKLKIPDAWWPDWLALRVLRGEAHQAIHGRPMPESPYERLFRGRVFHALERHDPSATEFIAAVTVRPDDADVWLTRSRIYARLGRNDRMTADLLHAQKLKGDDPNTWIATGRMLAERGEHQQADTAFARAAVLGKGELSRFLEAGWWVVGPYPDQIDRTCPPETNPDPSKPVAAVDRGGNLKWQSVSTNAVPGNINFQEVTGSSKTGTYYALAYVHADRERTAGLFLRTASDLRIWVNGKVVLDGFAAWERKRTQQSTPLPTEVWWSVSNDLIFYRESHELITGKPLPLDPLERLYRAQCYLHYGETEKAEVEFKAAVDFRPDDPTVVLARSRILEKLGRTKEAAADRARALQLAEDALVKRPEDAVAASVLGDLLLEKLDTKWTTIQPATATSRGGATLSAQPDSSLLVSGTNPDTDVYTIEAEVTGRIGAVRLEAIPDASLPNGYAGRNGNFILTDFRVTTPTNTAKWARAIASFSQLAPTTKTNHHPIEAAIDTDPATGWAIFPRYTETHWAVFVPVSPFGGAEKTRITIRLAFENESHVKHTLGRFRLSFAKESDSIMQNAWFLAATTPHAKVGAAYLAAGNAKQAADFLKKAVAANAKPAAEDWLILTLAHARLKETDHAKAACRKAGDLLKPKGADDALIPLVREVAVTLGPSDAAVRELIAAAAGEPPANLNEAIENDPEQAIGYRNRAEWNGGRGRWKEALADLAQANRIQATSHTGMREGVLLLYTGAINEYREVCRAMLEKWAATTNNGEADQTLKTYLLIPDYKGDAKQLARLAEVIASADKDADWYEWWVIAKALHDYRIGKHDDALATTRDSRSRAPKTKGNADALIAINLAIEAMALHGKDDADESRKAIEQAKSILKQHVPGIDREWWHDWLTAHILAREAERLIAGKKVEPPK